MRFAWVVRPYPHGKYRVKEFLSENIVALGWPHTGDLSGTKSREEIKDSLRKVYEYKSPHSLGQEAGNLYRFIHSIENEDYILIPDGNLIYIGKIDSEYMFNPTVQTDELGYPHQRKVSWLYNKKPINRSLFTTGRVYESLKSQLTVFSTYHKDIHEIVTTKAQYFIQQSNIDLKNNYLYRLQKGKLRNINPNTFEDVVCALFSKYFPGLKRQGTRSSEKGDTDLMTELPGKVVIRIQVKYWDPKKGGIKKEVVSQLADSMEPGDQGIIVTSGVIDREAYFEAENYTDRSIGFIDGQMFVDLLFESINDLNSQDLELFGLTIDFL